jgi:cell division septum initiation protein DivIVA
MFQAENQTLRASVEALRESVEELTESFESAVRMNELKARQQLEYLLQEHKGAASLRHSGSTPLSQKKITAPAAAADVDADSITAAASSATTPTASAPAPVSAACASTPQRDLLPGPSRRFAAATPGTVTFKAGLAAAAGTGAGVACDYSSPAPQGMRSSMKFRALATPGSIAKRFLEGTPGARPVQWVVEQANTEVKRLRERAELLTNGPSGIVTSSTTRVPAGCVAGDAEEESSLADAALWRMKIQAMKRNLSEALSVIQEQDRLIHLGEF